MTTKKEVLRAVCEEMNEKMRAGKYRCPKCEYDFGLMNSVSCGACGYVPKEHRW